MQDTWSVVLGFVDEKLSIKQQPKAQGEKSSPWDRSLWATTHMHTAPSQTYMHTLT